VCVSPAGGGVRGRPQPRARPAGPRDESGDPGAGGITDHHTELHVTHRAEYRLSRPLSAGRSRARATARICEAPRERGTWDRLSVSRSRGSNGNRNRKNRNGKKIAYGFKNSRSRLVSRLATRTARDRTRTPAVLDTNRWVKRRSGKNRPVLHCCLLVAGRNVQRKGQG
jgi:hypothetical protein